MKPDGSLSFYEFMTSSIFEELGPHLTDIVELPTSGYLAVGHYSNTTDRDIWIASLDAVGKPLWVKSYGGAQNPVEPLFRDDTYASISLTQDGGALVHAYTESLVATQDSTWAFKVFAKDGVLTFQPGHSGTASSLTFAHGSTCLADTTWAPTLSPLPERPIDQPITVVDGMIEATGL